MASIGPPALGAKGCVERLHPTGETTHYDLCVAGAPANHVRCASLRSGGRRLAVRTEMEHPIGTLPRTPFPASRDFAPVGSMSLDFQVASLSYKSSSFATSRGNEKIGGTGYCVTYDTDSQSRNVLASPLGEEGHEVAKGCTRVRMIMILLFYVLSPFARGAADWRSGPRRSILSVLCPVHPFPLRGTSPQGETRDMREKTASHILHVPFRRFPPLVVNAVSQSPACVSCHMPHKANPVTFLRPL